MAQRKPADNKKATEPKRRNPTAERYTVKPEFWDALLDNLPPWGDEIAAIVLIVFGVVSFLSLLNVSGDATISTAWSKALTGLFGYGSAIVCAGIFGLGHRSSCCPSWGSSFASRRGASSPWKSPFCRCWRCCT